MLNLNQSSPSLNSRGQSVVELGLITPLLLIALYIPVDFGVAIFTAHQIQNAVREGTRIAVTTKDNFNNGAATAIANETLNRMPVNVKAVNILVEFHGPITATCAQNVMVRARANYSYFFYQILRLFGGTVPNSLTITRISSMRYEFQPVTNGAGNVTCTAVSETATVTRA